MGDTLMERLMRAHQSNFSGSLAGLAPFGMMGTQMPFSEYMRQNAGPQPPKPEFRNEQYPKGGYVPSADVKPKPDYSAAVECSQCPKCGCFLNHGDECDCEGKSDAP